MRGKRKFAAKNRLPTLEVSFVEIHAKVSVLRLQPIGRRR